jgi:glyoxylase-like metal-dependent hydrolase (beta-lactamase superfamily II)
MLTVKSFTFFPELFGENTYVLSDETKACVVIDPGCYHRHEREELTSYIEREGLRVEKVLNTHCHIDHIFGNAMLVDRYGVPLLAHHEDLYNLEGAAVFAQMWGLRMDASPGPHQFIDEGDVVTFGNTKLEVIFTPGHSKGHVSFFHRATMQAFSGDVLFRDSVGRVDLPGGSAPVLIHSILTKLFPLGDTVKVHAGHMEPTTIGRERLQNPVVAQMVRTV